MLLKFTKMQGVGNDYIYVDARAQTITNPEKLAIRLADRHFGVGSDGLVLLQTADPQEADITMRIFNADGSEGMMCGNAVRCVAQYLLANQIVTQTPIRVATRSGVKVVRQIRDGYFSVNMGAPKLGQIPLDGQILFTTVDMGNPHAVWFTNFDLQNYDISRVGKRLQNSPLFPGGVNVEFAHVCGDNIIQMRVWERGSGETLGCGTGACAVAVASVARGLCSRERLIRVQLPGGELVVDYSSDSVRLLGPAAIVFTGEIEISGANNAD